MIDAPESLWADWDYVADDGVCGVHTHKKYASGYAPHCPPIQYTRADLVQPQIDAAVAAEREACAELCDVVTQDHVGDVIRGIGNEIRARAGVLDALEARDARVRAEALRGADGSFFALCVEGTIEADRAMKKFPQPNYVISKVAEEAGEVVKAAIHCSEGREKPQEVRSEIKQLIAMLYRLWVEGDQVHGLSALIPTDQKENLND
jgi:hypothetical protein